MYLATECNANPTLPDKEGFTPLHTACRYALPLPLPLRCPRPRTNACDRGRLARRGRAIRSGLVEMVAALLTIPNINPNAADAYGVRPIHVAVRRGYAAVRAAWRCRATSISSPPSAVWVRTDVLRDVGVVECLLKSKLIDPAAATVTFLTPLHDACLEPNPEIAQLLFQVRGKLYRCESANSAEHDGLT